MQNTPVVYEVFEEEKPCYFPSYIMSAFVLIALVALGVHGVPLWPLSLAHLGIAVWFGILFRWILQNARQSKLFMSQRLLVSHDTFKHSFRYAVAEATHVEIPISEIERVKVSPEEPRFIEVVGKSDSDIYFLPPSADIEQLIAVLRMGNPAIRVTS